MADLAVEPVVLDEQAKADATETAAPSAKVAELAAASRKSSAAAMALIDLSEWALRLVDTYTGRAERQCAHAELVAAGMPIPVEDPATGLDAFDDATLRGFLADKAEAFTGKKDAARVTVVRGFAR